jgi:hypothetical protein
MMTTQLEAIKELAKKQAEHLASTGDKEEHMQALAMFEHSDINPVTLAERGMRLHDLYYGDEGKAFGERGYKRCYSEKKNRAKSKHQIPSTANTDG